MKSTQVGDVCALVQTGWNIEVLGWRLEEAVVSSCAVTRICWSRTIGSFSQSDRAILNRKQQTNNFYSYFLIACNHQLFWKYFQRSQKVGKRLSSTQMVSNGGLRHFWWSKMTGRVSKFVTEPSFKLNWGILIWKMCVDLLLFSLHIWTLHHQLDYF